MLNQSEQVNQFLARLEHPMKDEVLEVRNIILSANPQITEHIKWNAPSFCYQGEDRVTFNLHAQGVIQLIFHRGAKAKNNQDFKFVDTTGLLEFVTNDRAKVELKSMQEVLEKKSALSEVVNQWIHG